jgi:ligand-binding sensor domain-containing protein/serine phosphatase RsbU (regulator of sigma subunit)
MKKLILGLLFFTLTIVSFSQRYGFKKYTHLTGLSQDFVYSIFQDNNGNLVISTGEGISFFDGVEFKNYSIKNGISENSVTCGNKLEDGTLVFGHNEGGITKYKNGKFTSFKKYIKTTSAITGISSIGNDIYYCTQNEGLFRLSENNQVTKIYGKRGIMYNNLFVVNENQILLGTSSGLIVIQIKGKDINVLNTFFEENPISTITQFAKSKKIIFAVLGKGIFTYQVNQESGTVSRYKTIIDDELLISEVTSVILDNNNSVWIGTLAKGLYHLTTNSVTKQQEYIHYDKTNGLETDFVKCLYEDHEGSIWVGSFGNGMMRPLENYFVFFPTFLNDEIFNVTAHGESLEGDWFGVQNGLVLKKMDNTIVLYNDKNGFKNVTVTAIKVDDGNLWIGTQYSGIYYYDAKKEKFEYKNWNLNSQESSINDIEIVDNSLWVATQGGLLEYDKNTKELNKYGTESGLPHNYISSLCLDKKNNLLIGTQNNSLLKLKDGEITEIPIVEKGLINVIDIFVDNKNNYWLATAENGVIMYNEDTLISFTMVQGLKSNYCYAIASDSKNNIWVGHSNGLSKIIKNRVKTYDHKEGILGRINQRSVFKGEKGYLWIGTSEGLIQYNFKEELKNTIPPIVNITKVFINDKEVDYRKPITLPAGNYKIMVEYRGISFVHPEGVKYKFKLEGFEEDYSKTSSNTFTTYGKVSAGDYTFNLIACNIDGICSEELKGFSLSIDLPFYQKTWVQIIFLLLLIGIVLLILRIRTLALKQRQIQLEEEITLKTAEIVSQKDKIESINKDISDSINYAEKIQRRIIPDQEELTDLLPGSFVYFKPKDIVSGDFYYFYDTGAKFIVAVGDCTGHGVPGAFMTFIGKITLRNIFANYVEDNLSPDRVLQLLDQEVESILGQKEQSEEDDYYKSRDGMDIVICEITKSNNKLRFASAMRPIVIEQNGVKTILKGTRQSIGGGFSEDKIFELNEVELKKGNNIYLFSDGITDQFGGPEGKKLKIDGLLNMLQSSHTKDSHYNQKNLTDQFENWMENKKQIDDVLLISIHL